MVIAAGDKGCLLIQAELEQQNFPALFTSAKNNDELQRPMNVRDCDIVLIDLPVQSLNLPEIIDCIRLRMPYVPVIPLAGRPDEAPCRELAQKGCRDPRPHDDDIEDLFPLSIAAFEDRFCSMELQPEISMRRAESR